MGGFFRTTVICWASCAISLLVCVWCCMAQPMFARPPRPSWLADLPHQFPLLNSIHGRCKEGLTYYIQSGQDLRHNVDDLECIYSLGHVPRQPPMGWYDGGILTVLNSVQYATDAETIWRGKMGFHKFGTDTCLGMVYNIVEGDHMFPGITYIGQLRNTLLSTEAPQDGYHLIIDFKISHLSDISPDIQVTGNPGWFQQYYNSTSAVDIARVVGYTKDDRQIILGKTLLRSVTEFPIGGMAVAWWFAVNGDKKSYSESYSPESAKNGLGPTPRAFNYYYKHSFKLLSYILGLESLTSDPLKTLQRVILFSVLWPLDVSPLPGSALAKPARGWGLASDPASGHELRGAPKSAETYPMSDRIHGLPAEKRQLRSEHPVTIPSEGRAENGEQIGSTLAMSDQPASNVVDFAHIAQLPRQGNNLLNSL